MLDIGAFFKTRTDTTHHAHTVEVDNKRMSKFFSFFMFQDDYIVQKV